MSGHDAIHFFQRVILGFPKGGGTADGDDAEIRTLAAQPAHELPRVRVRLVRHGARVDDGDVRRVRVERRLRAAEFKFLANPLGIVLVRLAPEGVEPDGRLVVHVAHVAVVSLAGGFERSPM